LDVQAELESGHFAKAIAEHDDQREHRLHSHFFRGRWIFTGDHSGSAVVWDRLRGGTTATAVVALSQHSHLLAPW
jgi:hypothetical protein